MAGWQPIETAPRDGAVILAWVVYRSGEADPMTVAWKGYSGPTVPAGFYDWPEGEWDQPATHWMPLPAPPNE